MLFFPGKKIRLGVIWFRFLEGPHRHRSGSVSSAADTDADTCSEHVELKLRVLPFFEDSEFFNAS